MFIDYVDESMLVNWIFTILAVIGAYFGTKKSPNLLFMNIFFSINNLYLIIYFFIIQEWAVLILNIIFLILSIRGIYNNIIEIKRVQILASKNELMEEYIVEEIN